MKNVMNCPNCGAEVFNPNGCGVQQCGYCRSNVDFGSADVQPSISNPDQNVTDDNNSADIQELKRKWTADIRNAMIIHAAIIMFSCIVSHFGSGVAGCVILMIDFIYAIVIASKLALAVVRPNMSTTTIIKVISVIVFYALFFIEYVATYTAISTILAFLK